jgi:hypothetical protein
MTRHTVKIGDLITAVAEFKKQSLEDNREIYCGELEIKIPSPNGLQNINYVIKKDNLEKIAINFANGHKLECAAKHILLSFGQNVFAQNLCFGDNVDTNKGPLKVEHVETNGIDDFYDIGIDKPYLYYDAVGIIHHNTILCCALSHLCEDYGRTIIIVPNKDLVRQTELDYRNVGLDVGVYFGERKEYNHKHTICTWQSLDRITKKDKDGTGSFTMDDFIQDVVCVIVDECVAKDTKILTPMGHVEIQNLKPGDHVFSFNESTGLFEQDVVIDLHKNLTISNKEAMYEIEMEDSSIIQITGNHKVLTDKGWKQIKELAIDDEIIHCNFKQN